MAVVFFIAAFFWIFEVIPLYATSLLVILLQTFLLTKAGGAFGIRQISPTFFLNSFANPIIILFLGGFVLAAALHKYHIDHLIAARLLRFFGTKPYFLLLGFMATTAFLSMWISNTATTAIMLSMIIPLLSDLESGDPFKKALVLSVAFAANIGGIATPVGTPPNAIVIGLLATKGIHLNFISWVFMATPLAILLLGITSFLLYFLFPPKSKKISLRISDLTGLISGSKTVVAIACLTIILWLTSSWHKIPESIVALLCVGLLSALGFFDRNDFKSIHWDILVLMWGGLALGDGMEISGLAKWIVSLPLFSHQGFILVAVFCLVTVLLSTFMSNTAAVNLIVPIAVSLPGENPVILATIVALASSFDIALPISTPPMTMAYATHEITVIDMLKSGILFTAIANILLLVGFRFVVTKAFGLGV